MPQSRALRLGLRVLQIAVILACFLYIGQLLARNVESLRAHEFHLRWPPLLASLPLGLLYLLGRAYVWHRIVQRVIGPHPLRTNLLSWMASLAGKYLPGKVFLLLGRVYFYRRHGAATARVSLGFLLEACCSALATLAVFALAAAYQSDRSAITLLPGLAAVAVGLLVVTHPAVLRGLLGLALRIARQPPMDVDLRWSDVAAWSGLIALDWCVLGAGFYLMLGSVIDVPLSLYPFLTGSFALAGVVGVLALFAPSGIGVREGVLAFTLAQVLPEGVAAVAALLSRIWITLAEALCAGAALWVSRDVLRGEALPAAE